MTCNSPSAAAHSKVFMGAPAHAREVLLDNRGRQARFDVIEVQVFEQLESDRSEHMGILQHLYRVPAPGPGQYRQRGP